MNLISDLISSRHAVIDALDRIFDQCEEIDVHLPEGDPDRTGYKMYPDYIKIREYLYQLSFVESEIIHCGECKYHRYDSKGIPYCGRIDYGYGWKDNDFCSRAERRIDG